LAGRFGQEDATRTRQLEATPGAERPGGENEVCLIPVQSVVEGDSPRLDGESIEHVDLLAASAMKLPPIVVHRETMRVIDGMHRLRAAQKRGDQCIEARFFEGTEAEAFIGAVRANIDHGLPLTLADREAAATRIIVSHSHCSDRWIATVTGLAAGTVGAIRRQCGGGEVSARIGRDGRVRPVNGDAGRRIACDAIKRNPDASLREIARLAGISPATVRDVRDRMRRGDDPISVRRSSRRRDERDRDERNRDDRNRDERDRDDRGQSGRGEAGWEETAPDQGGRDQAQRGPGSWPLAAWDQQYRASLGPPRDPAALLQYLRKDPSLRFTESGRALLRWLETRASGPGQVQGLVNAAPVHCAYLVAELARSCAQEWLQLARELEDRVSHSA
jgi:ParB-like nuclease domain